MKSRADTLLSELEQCAESLEDVRSRDAWRDFDLHIIPGRMVCHKLKPAYIRGRPQWIAKIDRPSSLPSTTRGGEA